VYWLGLFARGIDLALRFLTAGANESSRECSRFFRTMAGMGPSLGATSLVASLQSRIAAWC
jgi:hypothetical protein